MLIAGCPALVYAVAVGSAWIPLLPRDARRGMTEGLLRGVLASYSVLFLMSLVVAPVMAFLLYRARRDGRSRPKLAQGALFAFSCLLSLVLLEAGSTAWRLWIHRFPRLPTSFPTAPADEFRIVVLGGSSALGSPIGRGLKTSRRISRSGRSWPGGWARRCRIEESSSRSWRGWVNRLRTRFASWLRSSSVRVW